MQSLRNFWGGGLAKSTSSAGKPAEANKTKGTISVQEGLSALGKADVPKQDPASALKVDTHLRANAMASAALEGKDKPSKLVNLVNTGLPDKELTTLMSDTFSTYLLEGPSDTTTAERDTKTAERVGKLSQAVHAYVTGHPGSDKSAILADALRGTLAALPLFKTLDEDFKKLISPREQTQFLQSKKVSQMTQLENGRVNPYIFDKDRSDGIVCRDMTEIVSHANRVLSEPRTSESRAKLTFLREAVQAKSWTGEESLQAECERYEKNDMHIPDAVNNPNKNAYTLLGLSPTDPDDVVSERLAEIHKNRYTVEGLAMNDVRNVVYRLQTKELKASYDLYLSGKTNVKVKKQLENSVVTEAESRLFGTYSVGLRMQALIGCVNQALSKCPTK
jgi:hypothetical protein